MQCPAYFKVAFKYKGFLAMTASMPGMSQSNCQLQVMNMSGEQICVYQRQRQRLKPDLTHAGVAGHDFDAVVQWLKDGHSEMV